MTAMLLVRRLLIDLEAPFARHWCGGDAFRSAFFDALSMSFPLGEQFFIDSVRAGVEALPEAERERFSPQVQGFVGQEATHRRVHALFNSHLERQGYRNGWERRIAARLPRLAGTDRRHAVAITAATEHFTAILAEHLLAHPQVLDGAEPRLRALWLWHASEESEHRSVAFDLYRAMGGNEAWRRRWFRVVTMTFLYDALRQTASNLRRDGELWRWRSWVSGARFLFGREGVVRCTFGPWRAYRRADFHPSQQDSSRAERWLAEHADAYRVVGERAQA
ncbi:metal-dependent hydrolase [Caldimonas sp. KR1-144]|uniref:metal-dependent hydrolase n=1 Tax=Caldimonas sp. KR1-144 TaxID=3400911 RepID=UPI003BFF2BED